MYKINRVDIMISKIRKTVLLYIVGLLLALTSCAEKGAEKVKVYPAPKEIELSESFKVTVEEQNISVYSTKIPPSKPIPRLNPLRGEYGLASIASFDMNESVMVSVDCPEKVESVKILPTSYGIKPTIEGNKITFLKLYCFFLSISKICSITFNRSSDGYLLLMFINRV